MTKKVLLVGESWLSSATHYKGFDQFGSVTFHKGCQPLIDALKDTDYALTHMPAHAAQDDFPIDIEQFFDTNKTFELLQELHFQYILSLVKLA